MHALGSTRLQVVAAGAAVAVLALATFAVLRRRRGSSAGRAAVLAAGLTVAVAGCAVALLAPADWFDLALADLIGVGGRARTTPSQRAVAALGSLIAAAALAALPTGRALAPPWPARWRAALFALPVAGLLASNVWAAGAWLGAVSRPPPWREPWSSGLGLVLLAGSLACLGGTRRAPGRGPWLALATGAAYGCFSALWHCCPAPWWPGASATTWLADALWLGALSAMLGAVGALAARWPLPAGELAGALAFALLYPWHTPVFFAQCLLGGAFATGLVRITGSGLAPSAFLASAYVTHITLPFLGGGGVALAAAMLGASVALASRRSPALPAAPG